MTEQEIINYWKRNEKPFGLCPEEAQKWFKAQTDFYALVYSGAGKWVNWEKCIAKGCSEPSLTHAYRIPADYKPEKRGRWKECDVLKADMGYTFFLSMIEFDLYQAPGMIGFGGVQYGGKDWWPQPCLIMGLVDEVEKPMPPTKVRFWVEGD